MGNTKDTRIVLSETIDKLNESLDADLAKKINFKMIGKISNRLVEYYDECEICRMHAELLSKDLVEIEKNSKPLKGKAIKDFNRKIDEIVKHMFAGHKLVAEGHYQGLYMILGLILGLCFGVFFKNYGTGMIIGIFVGLAVGTSKDASYKKRGRVI